MIFVAQSTGAIITDDVSHTTWEKKFEQRFRAFHNVTNPPLLTFETYERLLQSGFPHKSPSSASDRQLVSIVPTLQAASACYLRGRQYLDAFRGTGVNKGGIQLPCVSAGDAIFKASSNVLYKVFKCIYVDT